MKHFIRKSALGQEPSLEHFDNSILPELESLYAALLPSLEKGRLFIYIGSTSRSEGTSTIAWALAYYIAVRTGEDCLYVDGNIRHPYVRRLEGLPENGLSDFLQGSVDFRMLPFPTELGRLAAVHGGRIRSSHVSLSAERARQFVAESRRYYRATIFDSLPGFDKYAEIWSRHSDTVFIVTSYRRTKQEILERVLNGFRNAGISISGILFNKREFPIPDFLYRRL